MRRRSRDRGLLRFAPRRFNRHANQVLQGWTAAGSALASPVDRQRQDKYSSEQYGEGIFELLVTGCRSANAASTVARSTLMPFFEISRT